LLPQQWKTLPPRPWPGALKPLSSAATSMTTLADGRLDLAIKHGELKGVTVEMLRWWYGHLDGSIEHMGRTYPRYLVWHPRDHIHYKDLSRLPDGSAGTGTRRQIVEAFLGEPRYLVNIIDRVAHLDEAGLLLVTEQVGLNIGPLGSLLIPIGGEVSTLEHRFFRTAGGSRIESRLLVGSDTPFGRLFLNRYARPRFILPDDMGRAWLQHNVEEVGAMELFLPALYAACVSE
jgi:hypothetical protein